MATINPTAAPATDEINSLEDYVGMPHNRMARDQ